MQNKSVFRNRITKTKVNEALDAKNFKMNDAKKDLKTLLSDLTALNKKFGTFYSNLPLEQKTLGKDIQKITGKLTGAESMLNDLLRYFI